MPELLRTDLGRTRVWASRSAVDRVRAAAPNWTVGDVGESLDCDTLIAVGGGTLIDEAKSACRGDRRVQLVAIPSLWGSGAEASKVIVLCREGKKQIRIDPAFLPDIVVDWPELGETVGSKRAREACGDVWAHTMEALLSPLASPKLRGDLGRLAGRMLELPLAYAPDWFLLSAAACAAQAEASVGLVHGIAHTLEGAPSAPRAGHAALCATFLAPVLAWDRRGASWRERLAECELDEDRIMSVAARLHDRELYASFLPILERDWRSVLRDPCTRTNGTLVRPDALTHFQTFELHSGTA